MERTELILQVRMDRGAEGIGLQIDARKGGLGGRRLRGGVGTEELHSSGLKREEEALAEVELDRGEGAGWLGAKNNVSGGVGMGWMGHNPRL